MKSNLKGKLSRREMLGAASAATIGAAMMPSSVRAAAQEQKQSYQVGKDSGKHEPIPNFKFDIEATTGWVGQGAQRKKLPSRSFLFHKTSRASPCG
jgi:hypothetical protein